MKIPFDRKCICGTSWDSSFGEYCPDCKQKAMFLGDVSSVVIGTPDELFGPDDLGIPVTDENGVEKHVDFNVTMAISEKYDDGSPEGKARTLREYSKYIKTCPDWTEEDARQAQEIEDRLFNRIK